MLEEPSVLDYIKSKIAPWRYPSVGQTSAADLPDEQPPDPPAPEQSSEEIPSPTRSGFGWPWRALLGLILGLAAQSMLDSTARNNPIWSAAALLGILLYLLAIGLIFRSAWRGEWAAAFRPPPTGNSERSPAPDPLTVHGLWLILGLASAGLVFFTSGDNLFSGISLSLFVVAIVSLVAAFRNKMPGGNQFGGWLNAIRSWFKEVTVSALAKGNLPYTLAFWAILMLSAYFRFSNLDTTPGEMTSDHAEKIMDVLRVLAGQTNIFFPNNGGREALQIYMVAAFHTIFSAEINFMALKIVSGLVGFLSLPLFYLLGKEIANRRVGLLAMAFAGVAYWPNVVSRHGLRLPFYFLFTALVMLFLVRGLQRKQRNDFIWLGIALGASLYGYSADRILPFLITAGIAIYLLNEKLKRSNNDPGSGQRIGWYFLISLVLTGVIFLPMLRYFLEQPEAFLYRTMTRISGVEQPLPEPAWMIFFNNTLRALAMVSWSNGEVWTTSIPYRPALDLVTGGLFWGGAVLALVDYLHHRRWISLFLLVSIPLLMLPSILSLAFPAENPNLYRTGGAIIPIFLLIALALDGLMRALENGLAGLGMVHRRGVVSWGLALFLFCISAFQCYDLVFNQYRTLYQLSAWNTSEMGTVIRNFTGTIGPVENVWLMGYPYWVDARLVGINAGYPLRNFAVFPAEVSQLPENSQAKLFLLNSEDHVAFEALQKRFPQGSLTSYRSETPGKDFDLFYVPPSNGGNQTQPGG
ncbi:MAG: glycosyltransferase family 39 protein [Anaerolineales bacterium]|jgi:hypothetical protein|nr:glycosyltransferase family 39 protein [Anaerolineales bacterium]